MAWLRPIFPSLTAALLLTAISACSGYYGNDTTQYPDDNYRRQTGNTNPYAQPGPGLFGAGGLTLGGTSEATAPPGGGEGLGVNSFLWRASLDTVGFMPLASADPFGGVIITDWYSPPEAPDERFKVNVFILTRDLRADGVRATVFKQRRDGTEWFDDPVDDGTRVQLENAILTRARELRIAQL
jgi:hypothetical protein